MSRNLLVMSFACLFALFLAHQIEAQTSAPVPNAIRVESNEVLVPVLVLDRARVEAFERQNSKPAQLTDLFRRLAVEGLADTDFQIEDDGRQQRIEKVTFGSRDIRIVRDALGEFSEMLGASQGLWVAVHPQNKDGWSTPGFGENHEEQKNNVEIQLPPLPAYLLAYVPSHPTAAPCHELSVQVDRPNSLIYTLKGYCSDRGTVPYSLSKTSGSIYKHLTSREKGSIPVDINAVPLISETGDIPVRVSLDFPAQSLMVEAKDCANTEALRNNMHLLGVVETDKPGPPLQFGDLLLTGPSFLGLHLPTLWPAVAGCAADDVISYQRQIYLPPGRYDLKVIFSVGEKRFGRAEMPLTVDIQNDQELTVSGIVLARRCAEAAKSPDDTLVGTYVPLVSRGVEYLPAANLTFKKTDPFFFYVEVRGPSSSKVSTVGIQLRLRIVDAKSGAVVRSLAPLNAADFAIPGNPIIPIGSGIHIDDLPPGNYQLQAQATTVPAPSTSGSLPLSAPPLPQTTPWHSVSFSIQ